VKISVKDHGDVNASYAMHASKWIHMLIKHINLLVENFNQKLFPQNRNNLSWC